MAAGDCVAGGGTYAGRNTDCSGCPSVDAAGAVTWAGITAGLIPDSGGSR